MKFTLAYLYKLPPYRLGAFAIMLFIVMFLVWATLFDIDEAVVGDGKVVPYSQAKTLQHLEGGIVSDIAVREGDTVEAGDVIYRLDQAFFEADLREQEIELMSLLIKEHRIKVMLEDGTTLSFSQNMTDSLPSIVLNETKIFETETRKLKEQIEALDYEINQKRLSIGEMTVRLENLELELKLVSENLEITERLLKANVASRKEYIAESSKKQSLVTQIGEVRNKIPIVEQEINEVGKRKEALRSEYEAKLLNELNGIKVKIGQLEEKKKATSDRDRRKLITTPVKGVVNKLYFYTVGGIIKSGDKVAEITPIDDVLMVEARIKAGDRARIWTGQKVTIEITAYDMAKYGLLEGELINISPDSFTDQQGKVYYRVLVRAKNVEFGKKEPILPGMVANVYILTGKKSVMEYILLPLKRISTNSLIEP